VLEGNEVHQRLVATGKELQQSVEITEGLAEGDVILADPQSAVSRLAKVLRTKKR
jgi:vacuolar-type H+-ATPase subunit D/Vma8